MANTKTIKQLQSFQSANQNDLLIIQNSTTNETGNTLVKNLLNTQLTDLENQSIVNSVNDLNTNLTSLDIELNQIKNEDIPLLSSGISSNADSISNIQSNITNMQNDIDALEQAIEQGGGSGEESSSNLNNLLDGSTEGSIRGINTATEENGYTIGENAIAEGYNTFAYGNNSHAEGDSTIAGGTGTHSEGKDSQANGNYSHAEGNNTNSTGYYSHAQNNNTIANSRSQTVIGEYNVVFSSSEPQETRGQYAFILGNGTELARSNALTVDWTGNVQLALDRSAAIGTTDGDLANALAGANFITTTDTMVNVKKLFTQLTNRQNTYEYELPTFLTSQRKDANYDFSNVVNVTAYGVTENVKDISLYAYGYNRNGNTWLQIWTTPIQFLGGRTASRGSWVEFSAQVPEKFIPRSQYFTMLYGIEPNASNSIYGDIFNLNSNMLSNYVANFALLKIAPIEEIDSQTQQTRTKWKFFISPMNLNKKDSSSSNQLIYICNCNYTSAYNPA